MNESGFKKENYFKIREDLVKNPDKILLQEKLFFNTLFDLLEKNSSYIESNFNAAKKLLPFWMNYSPKQRGNKPSGESIPWGEVGEKSLQALIYGIIAKSLDSLEFPALPFGHDNRFRANNNIIQLDIKTTGPNDRADEVVSSPNQVTGDGSIVNEVGIKNSKVLVRGKYAEMNFEPELTPFYLLEDEVLLNLTYYIKCIYDVNEPGDQPIKYVELVCVPNGLIMFGEDELHKKLFTPGKDQKDKESKRVRIKLDRLEDIDPWRRRRISLTR